MKTRKLKELITIAAILIIVSTICIGAFSYFTDYATKTVTATAGTFGIELEHSIDIDGDSGILSPGDVYAFDFTVRNTAQKSADVYVVVTITGAPADNTNPSSASPYKLLVDGTAACFDDSSEVERDSTSTNTSYVYVLPIDQLSGTIEIIDETNTEKSYSFEFGMDIDALNEWEGSSVTAKIDVYAKQHESTADVTLSDWKAAVEAEI